jgi:hypothetical protein
MANTTWSTTDKGASITLTGSNLIATNSTSAAAGVRAADAQASGKFYWEYTCNTFASANSAVGISRGGSDLTIRPSTATAVGECGVFAIGNIYIDGVNPGGVTLGTITAGTVVAVAIDCTGRLVWFRQGVAGNWNGSASANPATGAGGLSLTTISGGIAVYPTAWINQLNDQITANFGGSAFVGVVPSGFTSGFTSGAAPPTNMVDTQASLEEWIINNPQGQVTQVSLEQWASVAAFVPPVPGKGRVWVQA